MRSLRILPLICFIVGCCTFASAQDSRSTQVTEFKITRGALSFNDDGFIFKSAHQVQKFPFPESPKVGDTVPGLKTKAMVISPGVETPGQPSGNGSRMVMVALDGGTIELVFGKPVEVVRVEIGFGDKRHLTLWKVASGVE